MQKENFLFDQQQWYRANHMNENENRENHKKPIKMFPN